MTLKYWKQHHL